MTIEENRFPGYENDAWKKRDDLLRENTREWEPRPDLRVTAFGCDRAVRVSIGKHMDTTDMFARPRMSWRDTMPRNVSTMREFAQAILDACDFVDAANPKWAEGH